MARRAAVLTRVADMWGDGWDVREARPTQHGWPLHLGWPAGHARGKGGAGGARVVVTAPLAAHLAHYRHDPAAAQAGLPLGRTALRRLRALLGHHWREDRALWWLERVADLADLAGAEFAARHGVAPSAACAWRTRLLGRRLRPVGWWRKGRAAEVIATWPTAAAAEALGVAAPTVRRLRAALRGEEATLPDTA